VDILISEYVSEEALRGQPRKSPELSALSHHGRRSHLADPRNCNQGHTTGHQHPKDRLHRGPHIVDAHEHLGADNAVKRIRRDHSSIRQIRNYRHALPANYIENISPGDLPGAEPVHILVFSDFDALPANIMSVMGEKLFNVDAIDALSPKPSKCGPVWLKAAELREVGHPVEG
jgi:hypothetical protein